MIKDTKTKGDRFNTGKPKWGLVSFAALKPMVDVLEFGANKYSSWNWTKGLSYTEVCESMLRHIHSFMSGEDNDKESKLSHTAHILCNAMFLSYMFLFKTNMDDRHNDPNLKENNEFKRTFDYEDGPIF